MIITVQDGQNLMDIALLYYGSIDGIYDILDRNPKLFSPTQRLFNGDTLDVTDVPVQQSTATLIQREGLATDDEDSEGRGIGYGRIADPNKPDNYDLRIK